MPILTDPQELDDYINDLVLNRQNHENDDPLQIASALIYAIQTRVHFDIPFTPYLRNLSYSEKKEIKEIIKFNQKSATPSQNQLFGKLIGSLPKDKLAKKNEKRRRREKITTDQSDLEFIQGVENSFSALKLKVGDELKKTNVNMEKVTEYRQQIQTLQERFRQIDRDTQNPNIRKKVQQLKSRVLDSDEQLQRKMTYLQELQIHEDISPSDLSAIQEKISTNAYAFNHVETVQEKGQEVLSTIKAIRRAKLDPNQMGNRTLLEVLQEHKKWDDGIRYTGNLKFGNLSPEYIREGFYVMHGQAQGDKNDIKMHVSIDPLQANIAMEIIAEMAQSEKYRDLIHEFKIGDIEHIKERIDKNKQQAIDYLTEHLKDHPNINVEALINGLKENPDKAMNDVLNTIPEDKKEAVKKSITEAKQKYVDAIISGERILNEALFTVYFQKDMKQEDLKEFSQELHQRFQDRGIKNGKTANTDVSVNAYCGITIDHIMENGKKVYLEGDNPESVRKRQQALKENPLTKELIPEEIVLPPQDIPPPPETSQIQTMAMHEDPKDKPGLSAFTVKKLALMQKKSGMSLEERAKFTGLLVAERFVHKDVNLTYRNPEMFTRALVREILKELKYPVSEDKKIEFFQLVERATGDPSDENAKNELQRYVTDSEKTKVIADMLLPFYHDYLEDVKKEFEDNYKNDETLPKDEQRKAYYQAREDRLNKAKEQFLGHFSFPFVESLVFELQEKDGFTPERKAKLALSFRKLREKGLMNDVVKALDEKNQGYIPYKINKEEIQNAFGVFESEKNNHESRLEQHRQLIEIVAGKSIENFTIVNRIAASLPDGNVKDVLQRTATSFENIKSELDLKLLRGDEISQEDVDEVQQLYSHMMQTVKIIINSTNENGETMLHDAIKNGDKKLVEALLKAGADPRATTVHYERSMSMFKGEKKPRTATELASKLGYDEIHQALLERETQLNTLEREKLPEVKLQTVLQDDDMVSLDAIFQHPPKEYHIKEPKKNPFVESWLREIKVELQKLDKGPNSSKAENVAIYALNRIRNLMTKNPDIDHKSPILLNVLKDLRSSTIHLDDPKVSLPRQVQLMLDQIELGTVIAPKEPTLEARVQTEYVEQWKEHIGQLLRESKDTRLNYALERIQSYLNKPDIMKDKLEEMLQRVQAEIKDTNLHAATLNKMINVMKKGELPEQLKDVHFKQRNM